MKFNVREFLLQNFARIFATNIKNIIAFLKVTMAILACLIFKMEWNNYNAIDWDNYDEIWIYDEEDNGREAELNNEHENEGWFILENNYDV
jgi:hypothetical protein